ncbi:carbohydrate ABC transporter permease [Nonomuraea soli]|uniref:Multiple sugar transport system permease protein n=1 Tax=Nonomuraea soli TaxID=1032476 RepID=A0A7W0CQT6_9ACTN|nr:sugar ABC transporter permease [Nonomuraea soli]MBA2895503.1 multiple sugar transport system permease protein [Nonomuraea soli]
MNRVRTEQRLGWLMAGPALLLMLAVTVVPVLRTVALSLERYSLSAPGERAFAGLGNYREILTGQDWWRDLSSTVILTVTSVGLEFVLGFALALAMHKVLWGRQLLRTVVLVPYAVLTVVSAFAFRFAFQPSVGFVGGDFNWLGETWSAYTVIVLTEVWKTTPFMALMLLAGLVTVPGEVYEAAKVDGANAWQRLWRVTIPCVRPAIMVALLFRTLDAFRIFDTVYIQTQGAVGTETLSFLSYRFLIRDLEVGLGSAVSVLLFVCVAMIAAGFVRAFRGAS